MNRPFLCGGLVALWSGLAVLPHSHAAEAGDTLRGRLIGFQRGAVPAVVHVFEGTDPAAGREVWREAVVVGDSGKFEVVLRSVRTEFLVFECPPFRWQALVQPFESAEIELRHPRPGALRLQGVPGPVRWNGPHPSAALDTLAVAQARLEAEGAKELLLLSGGVAGGRSLLDAGRLDSLQAAFQHAVARARTECAGASPEFHDLVAAAEARWSRTWSVGGVRRPSAPPDRAGRSDAALLKSPGYVAWMRESWGRWWTAADLDAAALRSAVARLSEDSLAALGAAMGMPEGDPWTWGAAWLVRAIDDPGPAVEEAFARFAFPEALEQAYRAVQAERGATPSLEGVRWQSTDGELQAAEAAVGGGWTVLLFVRYGSTTAERERELLAALRDRLERRDVRFLVVSLDIREEDWERTVEARRPRERLVWLGNDPRALRALQISAVPQTVLVGPDGRVEARCSGLPSAGLEGCLARLPR